VDVENRSLKSVGTPEADAQRRRVQGFGDDLDVVLVLRELPLSSRSLEPGDEAAVHALARRLEAEPCVAAVRELATRDHAARGLGVRVRPDGGGGWEAGVERVEALARRMTPATLRLALSGRPVAELAISEAVRADQARVVPLVVVGLALLLLAVYRRPSALVAILLPAAMGILWTGGILALLGRALDPIAVLLDPVLLTVGVAGGVHLVERYLSDRALGLERWDAARDATRDLWLPATLTSFTTVVGFLSLALHPIPAVADFGVFAALGVSLTSLFALVLTPTLLALLDRGVNAAALARRLALWDALGAGLSGWITRRASAVRWASVLLALAGAEARPQVSGQAAQAAAQRCRPRRRQFVGLVFLVAGPTRQANAVWRPSCLPPGSGFVPSWCR